MPSTPTGPARGRAGRGAPAAGFADPAPIDQVGRGVMRFRVGPGVAEVDFLLAPAWAWPTLPEAEDRRWHPSEPLPGVVLALRLAL